MAYKPIGRKSTVKPFKTRKMLKMKRRSKVGPSRSLVPAISNRHYATITETVELTDINANQNYLECFELGQFSRAFDLAKNFKFYRAKQVLFKYEPVYNLFNEGGETIPLAYMVMNRTQEASTGWGVAQFQEQGALPRKFTSQITMKYTPNWCTPGLVAQKKDLSGNVSDIIQQGVQKCYKFLMTPNFGNSVYTKSKLIETNGLITQGYEQAVTPNAQVIYNGHLMHFQQANAGTQTVVARRTVTVVWEFRGPKTQNIATGEYTEIKPEKKGAIPPLPEELKV